MPRPVMPRGQLPRARLTRRAAASALAAAALLSGSALLPGGRVGLPGLPRLAAAHADPTSDARARAAALAAQVHLLQRQAEAAAERYDAAAAQLQLLVTRRLAAGEQLDAITAAQSDGGAAATSRIRAVYEAGGSGALAQALLDSADLTDFAARVVIVRRIVGDESLTAGALGHAAGAAARLTARYAALSAAATALQGRVAADAAAVTGTLARTQSLLAGADAQVTALVAQAEAARAAADAQSFVGALLAAHGSSSIRGLAEAPPSPLAATALAAARGKLGTPYLWGGTGPDAFDCSGLVGYAFAAAGVAMPRTAAQQYLAGPHPSLAQLQPGDLLFWASDPTDPATIDHVAIYVGGGRMISDNHTGDVLREQPVWSEGFAGITRVDPAAAAAVGGPRWALG